MRQIERFGLEVATLAVVVLALLITVNVVGRELFGAAIPDTIVLVRELMIPAIMLPLGAATAARGHIAVTFLADRSSAAWQGRLIIFGTVVALLALLPLIYSGWRELGQVWRSASVYDGQLDVPRWPMRAVFLFGLLGMWVRLAMLLVSDLREYRATGTVRDTHADDEESV